MIRINRNFLGLYGVFLLLIALNIGLWTQTNTLRPSWGNVPPAMSERSASIMALGDREFAYRMLGLTIQNIGNTAGTTTPLKDYDYNALKNWFFLEDKLDPASDFMPNLAAYYFGFSQNNQQLTPVIDYLRVAGQRPEKDKWRWLAYAVYLARFKQGDLTTALDIANILANEKRDDIPLWARSMPAFVMSANGNKQAAYAVLMSVLSSSGKNLKPDEIFFIQNSVCTKLLTPDQAAKNKLCTKTR
jgi:hypothetical protein